MKILNIDDMLEAAHDSKMPDFKTHQMAIEGAATSLAYALARHLKIRVGSQAEWEGKHFGGTCAGFKRSDAGPEDFPCPAVIHEGDPDGDWE
jgi:hypothetical protein